jgi:hypothetical protein
MARALGRRGGRARARRLSKARKRRIASMGAHARVRSLQAARRIVANFRYADAVLSLSGCRTAVTRLSTCDERLPGLYRARP